MMAVCIAIMLSGCTEPIETSQLDLSLHFMIPSGPVSSAPRRVMGDPGTAERLDLPHYAYVFVVFKRKDGAYDIRAFLEKDLYEGKSGDSEVWELLDTGGGDVIYHCLINFSDLAPIHAVLDSCHIYAAMSKVPLTLKSGSTVVDDDHLPANEAAVQNITFTVDDALQSNLQNVYSTPYNNIVDGRYYADVNVYKMTNVNIILYHVASKVDLMWNVPEDVQTKIHVTRIKAKNLFKGDALLFKPTENIHTAFTSVDGYTPADLTGDVAGTWWAGRKYFYTIPYKPSASGKFPLQVDFDIRNVEESSTYTYELTMNSSVPEVFVPWMRGQLTVSTPPTASRVINVDVDGE